MSRKTEHQRLMKLALQRALVCEADIEAAGISSTAITRAVASGDLERVNVGLYRHPNAPWDENINLSEVAARVPKAIVVLISALQFHHIGTHQAHSIWILLKNNAATPRIHYPPIEVVRSGIISTFEQGVECHKLNDIKVHITSPARTVVDCFKYRNRVGLDVCLEALREVVKDKKARPAEIMQLARMQRVSKVMLPYLEAIV